MLPLNPRDRRRSPVIMVIVKRTKFVWEGGGHNFEKKSHFRLQMVFHNTVENFNMLVSNGANPCKAPEGCVFDHPDEGVCLCCRNMLHTAVQNGNAALVEAILKTGIDASQPSWQRGVSRAIALPATFFFLRNHQLQEKQQSLIRRCCSCEPRKH